jgi:CRISPR system Cascade subunit CasE
MNYLSEVTLDKREAAQLRLRDTYAWHQLLWQGFPGTRDEPRSFLFRVDDRPHAFRVLVLSPESPVPPAWGRWRVKKIADSFLSHDHFMFQVRANPTTKRVVRDDTGERKKNGRRTGMYDAAALLAWITRKARQAGAEILECTQGPAKSSYFQK